MCSGTSIPALMERKRVGATETERSTHYTVFSGGGGAVEIQANQFKTPRKLQSTDGFCSQPEIIPLYTDPT